MTQEEKRAYDRARYQQNREKMIEKTLKWIRNNREKFNAANRERARKRRLEKFNKELGMYPNEEWRPVKGYEGIYEVSDYARVRSLDRYYPDKVFRRGKLRPYILYGHVLKQQISHKGYLLVPLRKDNKDKKCSVHRLVAEAFIPNPDNLPLVNHKDECKTNNRPDNLEWCDDKYNVNYGTGVKRGAQKRARTVEQYSLDGVLIATYLGVPAAADATGIKKPSIVSALRRENHICKGYEWKYAN